MVKRKTKVLTDWKNLPSNFKVEDFEGFVYLIVNTLTGMQYIGRKYFWSVTKKKVPGKSRRKVTKSESDWRYYESSCLALKEDIKKLGKENFEFYILSLHKTRGETNYTEIKEQFQRDVLYAKKKGKYLYYNTNILSRYFRPSE